MSKHYASAILISLALLTAAPLSAAGPQEEEVHAFEEVFGKGPQEEDVYRSDRLLESATKHLMDVSQAPAIASVITANDIRQMGARNLLDAIARIPGIGITRNHYSAYPIEIRGIKAVRQNKIKFMMDGHTINMPTVGEPFWGFEDIALEQVERVEVIRGPGSALYGANAFTGIINVVTKSGNDINGTQVSAGGGSFDTGRANILHGKQYGAVDVLASLAYTTTEGAHLDVARDAIGQSGLTDDWADAWDSTFKVSWNDLVLSSRYTTRKNGPYIGVTNVVNDDSELMSALFNTDLSYARTINDRWNVNARAYYDYADVEFAWQIFPPGMALSPAPEHFFPFGVYGTPQFKNRTLGIELASDYAITAANTLTFGVVYEYGEQYDLAHFTNFHPITFVNLGAYQDISSWGNWNIPADRTNLAGYLQEEWKVRDNLSLTAGIRHDNYDDVGDSTNPRMGLVWELLKDVNLKLLYGEAFRIPTFDELYSINNPASVGNPDLKPEKMTTYEVSLGHTPLAGFQSTATGFYNQFTDKIDLVPNGVPGMLEFQNTDEATIYGVELDAGYRFQDIEIYGNYYWNHAEDDRTGEPLPDVPNTRWNLGLNFWVGDWGQGNLNLLYVGDKPRAAGDAREDLDHYTLVDANLIVMNFFKTMELRASVYNVFDEDYAYPAPRFTLANDYPAPGRSVFLEVRYTF